MCCPVAVLVSAVDVVCIFLLREVAGSEAAEEADEGTARGGTTLEPLSGVVRNSWACKRVLIRAGG